MFQPEPPTPTVLEFVERYMATDDRVVGVGIGELDGRETLKVQVTDLGVDLPETFKGVPVVLERFPPEAETLAEIEISPEIRRRLESDPEFRALPAFGDGGILGEVLRDPDADS